MESDEAFAGIWADFVNKPAFEDHFSRHQSWAKTPKALFVYAVINDAAAIDAILDLQSQLHHPALVPVRPESLHVTVMRIAASNEVNEVQRPYLLEEVSSVCDAFDSSVKLGPLNCMSESPFLEVHPADAFDDLRAALTNVCESTVDSFKRVVPVLPPHLSLAYANEDGEAVNFLRAVRRLRNEWQPLQTSLKVGLVELQRPYEQYIFQSVS